ncbi:hypothetical protein RCZ04_07770 [Capnocytophaga sp. HP1101]
MAKTTLQITVEDDDLPIFESIFEKFEVESKVVDNPLFIITESDVQFEAQERLGRNLNDDELLIAKKGLEWGLLTDIDTVYGAIFSEIK